MVARSVFRNPPRCGARAVREVEDLRRRAVVLLEAHDRRVGEPFGEAEQVLGRRAGERVDRLVVVAHDAEVVARAEPSVEQPGLERVHVLVLVDGEGVEPGPDDLRGLGVLVEQSQGETEHVLEVEASHRVLAALVPLVDPQHQLRRDRRLVIARARRGTGPAGSSGSSPTRSRRRARGGGGTCAAAAARSRARRSAAPCGRAPGERLAGVRLPQPRELRERGRVERARLDAVDVERSETPLQLPGGLLRERDREDLRCLERAAPDLARDAMRDRGGLPRAGAARIATGPRSARAASRWASFSPARTLSSSCDMDASIALENAAS